MTENHTDQIAAEGRLAKINLKLKRTKHHVLELDAANASFGQTNPYAVGAWYDAKKRKLTYYVAKVSDVPPDLSLIAADAFGGMISTLDHIVYQLWLANGGVRGVNDRHLYFPIVSDIAKYESVRQKKAQGLSQPAMDTIDTLEPYKGGAGHQFWILQELNNLSKHRDLITVGSVFSTFNLGLEISRHAQESWAESFPDDPPMPLLDWHVAPNTIRCPIEVGDEVLTIENVDAKVNNDKKFSFNVAINEPQITQSQPIVELVHQLENLVESTITNLSSFL